MSFFTLITITLIISLASVMAFKKYESNKIALNRSNAWPEVLDLIIASLQSGASISESLSAIGKVGPAFVREPFLVFSTKIESGERFEAALNYLKMSLQIQSQTNSLRHSILHLCLAVEIA